MSSPPTNFQPDFAESAPVPSPTHPPGSPAQAPTSEPTDIDDDGDPADFDTDDWAEEQTYGASLGSSPDKHGKVGVDKLWDDEWDDDDVDDDMSERLRKIMQDSGEETS